MKLMQAIGILFLLCIGSCLYGQSIAEKKASIKSSESDLNAETEECLFQVNEDADEIHAELRRLYQEALALYGANADVEEYRDLLEQINNHKKVLYRAESAWREIAARNNRVEEYGLWHAPETTLEQLIIDYGSQDYVYLIPPEVGSIKLSVDSNLPIPRSCWNEMLELILEQNGVGIKTLNAYLRQLYLIKQNNSNLKTITNSRTDLDTFPSDARVSFVISPEPSEVRRVSIFLEKFINPNSTVIQTLGCDILLVGPVSDIQDLLRLYDFVACNRGDKEYRLIPVNKVKAEEMAKILAAMFDQEPSLGAPTDRALFSETNGLKVIVLENISQALFIVGTKEEIRKAEEVIANVENQMGGARDKIVYRYAVKHSEPVELAEVLYRVYNLMIDTGAGYETPISNGNGPDVSVSVDQGPAAVPLPLPSQKQPPPTLYGQEGYYQEGGYIVNPAPAQPGLILTPPPNMDRDNFIVDVKTGSIVMVVESDILPKLKDLLRKLDVQKKMVQIETLLFEKVLRKENNFGLNLLRLGGKASDTHFTGAAFNDIHPDCPFSRIFPIGCREFAPFNLGVFEFLISRKCTDSGIPAFDLAYRFLLSQDDIQVNSSPSILTVNQTPATISILEDMSINTGVFEVETAKGVTLKDAFTRAQYGITISIKPSIHLQEECDEESDGNDYVSLETDITFDTVHGDKHDRPNVTRRHIVNQVQVVDGDTVVIGGLRRKVSEDKKESVPFLGELPGIGKLFSFTSMKDSSTEMFIFITPHIVHDPKEQLAALRQQLLCRRPGDVPYFLECLEEAHQLEKTRLMQGSLEVLLGRPPTRYYIPMNEYDGR